jgi:hypothetical protein
VGLQIPIEEGLDENRSVSAEGNEDTNARTEMMSSGGSPGGPCSRSTSRNNIHKVLGATPITWNSNSKKPIGLAVP